MSKLSTLSLSEWFIFGIGKFLMGLSLGLALAKQNQKFVLATFLTGIILEIPSLISVYKHRS